MNLLDFTLIENLRLSRSTALLRLHCEEELPEIRGGQFVNVLPPPESGVMLRRPISVCNVDYSLNELWLMVKDLGRASGCLVNLEEGSVLNILLPLGNGFSMPPRREGEELLIGGGVGIAPLLYWGRRLFESGCDCRFLFGGKTAGDLPLLNKFEELGEVMVTTEDGSMGEKGFVTGHSWLASAAPQQVDAIYCCGPLPMMKSVAGVARRLGAKTEMSLENKMACGLGACLCCVEDTMEGNVCTCTHGPVFDLNELKW